MGFLWGKTSNLFLSKYVKMYAFVEHVSLTLFDVRKLYTFLNRDSDIGVLHKTNVYKTSFYQSLLTQKKHNCSLDSRTHAHGPKLIFGLCLVML